VIPSTSDLKAKSLIRRIKEAHELGDDNAFVALANEVAGFAFQPDMAEAARRLMSLAQKTAPHRTEEVAQILVRAGTPASRPYLVVVAALDAAAPHEPGVARFMANRRQAKEVLQAALAAVPDSEAMSQKLRLRLARVLWQIGEEEGLSNLITQVAERAMEGRYDPAELAKMALMCMESRNGSILREAVSVARQREPNSQEILRAHVRGLLQDRQPIKAWWPRLKQAAVDHPDNIALRRFAGFCGYSIAGDWEFAEELLTTLANESHDPDDWERAGLAALRMGHDDRASEWLNRARPRVSPRQVGPLAGAIEFLLRTLNREYHWSDIIDYRDLQQGLRDSIQRVERHLSSADYQANDFLQAATAIGTVEKYPFYVLSELEKLQMYVERWDARYGTFDLKAYGVVWRGLVEHQALLLEHGLKGMLKGSSPGGLNVLREVAEGFTRTRLALDEPEAARETLQALISAECNELFFEELVDQCLLHRSNVTEVQARVRACFSRGLCRTMVCAVALADDWIRREKLEPQVLWEEGPFEGCFEKATSSGQIETHAHKIPPFTLQAMAACSLTLVGSEILIGRNGTALRPSHWHYQGVFPERTGIARSAAAGGAVIDLSGPARHIEEPVVVLAVNDTARQSNYYHWTNYILTRCAFLVEQGFLKGRRLLMPAEIQPWMRDVLELVGLSEHRLLSYATNEVLHIAEATVISGFDYPGAEYMRRFRNFMWKKTKATTDDERIGQPVHIFMARPTDCRRPFFGRERILCIAQDEGFQCIDPSDFAVADQVRLFASAASVAGLGGAAFTNMAFCRPGMPALELTRRETTWPDYTGIALALGIQYRFCPGWIDPSASGTPHANDAPTRFDEVMVQRELKELKRVGI